MINEMKQAILETIASLNVNIGKMQFRKNYCVRHN